MTTKKQRHQWTPEQDAMLGTMSDKKIGDLLGVSIDVVSWRRRKLFVAPLGSGSKIMDVPGLRAIVGKVPDSKIAGIAGLHVNTVSNFRACRGIKASRVYKNARVK